MIVAVPPEVLQAPPDVPVAAEPVSLVAGGERRQDSVANAVRGAAGGRGDRGDPRRGAAVRDARRHRRGPSTRRRKREPPSPPSPRATPSKRSARTGRRHVHRRNAAARGDLPRPDTAGLSRQVLRDAIAEGRKGAEATDEAALAERAGHPVRLVEGSARNLKITTTEDLAIAEALIAMQHGTGGGSVAANARVGTGYDLHRLVEGRPLVLGGVTDSLRSRAGRPLGRRRAVRTRSPTRSSARPSLGDIGHHFPDTDPRWKGASSLELLSRAAALVRERGFAIVNVDASVVAERPKLRTAPRGHRGARSPRRWACRARRSASRARPTKASTPRGAARPSPPTRWRSRW